MLSNPYVVIVFSFLILVFWTILGAVGLSFSKVKLKELQNGANFYTSLVRIISSLLAIACILFYYSYVTGNVSTLGFSLTFSDFVFLLTSIIVIVLGGLTVNWLVIKNGILYEKVKPYFSTEKNIILFALALLSMASAIFAVELVFRGVIKNMLWEKSIWKTLALSIILFAAYQAITGKIAFHNFIFWVAGGMAFFIVYLHSRSLVVASAVHFAFNFVNALFITNAEGMRINKFDKPLDTTVKSLYYFITSLIIAVLAFGIYTR